MTLSTRLPVTIRRRAYRFAYAVLRVYWFLRRPRVDGVKCVLSSGDRILLVRHTYGSRDWMLPGGWIRRHEPPPSAARREMREEMGIDIEDWTSLGVLTGSVNRRLDTLHCFQAEVRDPALTFDRGELAAVGWFPRAELPADLGPYVRPILARWPPEPSL